MATRPSVLFDLDVILDALQRREPFFDVSARALGGAETGQVHGWVAAHSLTTLFRLLAKHQSAPQRCPKAHASTSTRSIADATIRSRPLTLWSSLWQRPGSAR